MPKSYEQLMKDGTTNSHTLNQTQRDPSKRTSFVIEEENGESETVDRCNDSSTSSATEGPQAHDIESMDSDFENDTGIIELFQHHVVSITVSASKFQISRHHSNMHRFYRTTLIWSDWRPAISSRISKTSCQVCITCAVLSK